MAEQEIYETIDNKKVLTRIMEIGYDGFCKIGVECGTNGGKGGDSGWGCRAYLRLWNESCADFRVEADDEGVTIITGGDAELDYLSDALLYASRVLKSMDRSPLDRYNFEEMEDVGGQKAYDKYEKFYHYINELKGNYDRDKTLNHISDIATKYHSSKITKIQFFQFGIDKMSYISKSDAKELYDKIFKSEKK